VIAVIGAGPAGLAAAAALQRRHQRVVVFERADVGAAWDTRYDRLHLHTVRWLSGLPGYPMPRAYGRWPSRDQVRAYLREYARRMHLDVRTGIEVDRIERERDTWQLVTGDGVIAADRVVVATGNCTLPDRPDWPGRFPGEIVHSVDYRNPEPYVGRRVLVVGGGNSGAEIAVDLVEGGAAEVMLSVRSVPSIVRRDTFGVPSQLFGIASAHLPVRVVDAIARALRRISLPDLTAYGLAAPRAPYSDFLRRRVIPILDVGLVDAVRSGRIRVVAALQRFEQGEAVLADGSRVQVDAVIAATGYRTGLEPLAGHLGVLDASGRPLMHGPHEHPNAPGLYFVGFQLTLGGTFRLVGTEARRLARTLPPVRSRPPETRLGDPGRGPREL
jgi:putative flavoprotein involved in K+ transport